MGSDDDLLMFAAVDEFGRAVGEIPSAVLSRRCVQDLVGQNHEVSGAVLEPGTVLEALDGFVPGSRESRHEYSAILRLALVAETRSLLVGCDGRDPTTWAPKHHRDYANVDVQTALGFIGDQLHCTVDHAAHRLFALVEESGAPLIPTSRDVISGRLSFVGSPTGPTVTIWTHEGSE